MRKIANQRPLIWLLMLSSLFIIASGIMVSSCEESLDPTNGNNEPDNGIAPGDTVISLPWGMEDVSLGHDNPYHLVLVRNHAEIPLTVRVEFEEEWLTVYPDSLGLQVEESERFWLLANRRTIPEGDYSGTLRIEPDAGASLSLQISIQVPTIDSPYKLFGTPNLEFGSQILPLDDGGVIILGGTYLHLRDLPDPGIWKGLIIARLDAQNELLSQVVIGDSAGLYPHATFGALSGSESIIVVGYFRSNQKIFIKKLSFAGEIISSQIYGEGEVIAGVQDEAGMISILLKLTDQTQQTIVNLDNDGTVTGQFDVQEELVGNGIALASDGGLILVGNSALVQKLNRESGDVIWSQNIVTESPIPKIHGAVCDADNIYVHGEIRPWVTGGNHGWIGRLTSTGVLEWDKDWGFEMVPTDLLLTQSQDIFVMGYGGYRPVIDAFYTSCVSKLDRDGDQIWIECYGFFRYLDGAILDAAWMDDGSIAATGISNHYLPISHGPPDMIYLRISQAGDVLTYD
ncbi:hypothetical protein ACFL45_09125 [Candidatus Neomarinimicrobiota bacterium]